MNKILKKSKGKYTKKKNTPYQNRQQDFFLQKNMYGGDWRNFFTPRKISEIYPQVKKIWQQYRENFGIWMNPRNGLLTNEKTENVFLGQLHLSHPVLGKESRPNALGKTFKRSKMIRTYLHTIKSEYLQKLRLIETLSISKIELLNKIESLTKNLKNNSESIPQGYYAGLHSVNAMNKDEEIKEKLSKIEDIDYEILKLKSEKTKFEKIRDGEDFLDYLNLSSEKGEWYNETTIQDEIKQSEIFWSENEGKYDPILAIPVWLPIATKNTEIKQFMKKNTDVKNIKKLLHLKPFRQLFGICPCGINDPWNPCNEDGFDSFNRIKCNIKKDGLYLKYLVLSGQGRILALRIGLMDYNNDIETDAGLTPDEKKKLTIITADAHPKKKRSRQQPPQVCCKCKINVTVADSELPHGMNYLAFANYYTDQGLYTDNHKGNEITFKEDGRDIKYKINLNNYQAEEYDPLPRAISCKREPSMNDIEQYWLINKYSKMVEGIDMYDTDEIKKYIGHTDIRKFRGFTNICLCKTSEDNTNSNCIREHEILIDETYKGATKKCFPKNYYLSTDLYVKKSSKNIETATPRRGNRSRVLSSRKYNNNNNNNNNNNRYNYTSRKKTSRSVSSNL